MVDSNQIFSLNDIQKNKYSYLGENEKHLIKPYYDERDNDALNFLLDPTTKKEIDQQIRIKSCITSQVIFYVQVYLDLVKQKLEANKEKKMNEFLLDFKIGIIGCGVIGKSILNALIFLLGWIEPNNIHISTRRPENLSKYEDIGFNIYFDNEKVFLVQCKIQIIKTIIYLKLIEQCDVIIISFPPSLDNWAIVELRDSIHERQQSQNKPFQPFIISVVSNLYINKLQKLLLTSRIFARTHIIILLITQKANKDEIDSELIYGVQIFQDKELIKQLLITFQFIFNGDKLKEDEFSLSDVDSSIQQTLLGKSISSFEEEDLLNKAAALYEQRNKNFKSIMEEILKVQDQ